VNARVLIALFLVAVFALGAVLLAARSNDDGGGDVATAGSRFEGAVMPEGLRAPDFNLRNQDGERVSMRALRGDPVIVTFLYTNCDDTCPAQAQTVRGALDELGEDVPALAVAVDPARDTPTSARRFLVEQGMTGRMDFALGPRERLAPVCKGFAVQPQLTDAEHQARIALVDARGFQRIGFPLAQASPDAIAHDVGELEREAARG
jgi:protein SCO1/2